ncbi:MAG: type 2 lantipeptide synthetase LanM, partial [Caldilineaceae bacterium]|nr:type 2 lantipeptide synthetase LanM [Caldilineaceae bacterium]
LRRLREPDVALAFFAEYPVLARQLVTKVHQTSAALVEILTHLVADWVDLASRFADNGELGPLVAVEIGAGDTHRDGRAVAILRFAADRRIVYKPRSLAIDVHFQTLLTWLNEQGAAPPFRILTVLDRGTYGWIEFVATAPCANTAELERFYTRQGGYLALIHLLSAADFHFENLIAAGEHPMLIDLEALFHPDIMEYDPGKPGELAQQALDGSVLSIGMLPQRLRFHADAATIDISGLGAAGTQLTPDKLPVWEGVGTDEMHLTRRHIEFRSDGHRPALADQEVDVRHYGGAVAQGFAQIYRLLLRHRDALLAADGPLAHFAAAEMRVVARATRTYSLLLQESTHPDLLRNALERDRLYGRLWRDVAVSPRLARLVPSERRDLHNGDVPIFHTHPAATSLWDSRGVEIPEFLPECGLDRVRHRIDAMGEADLARQLWYIHASFATIDGDNSHHQAATATATHGGLAVGEAMLDATSTATFVLQARTLGEQLAGLAHRYQEHAVWIGLGLDA